MDRLMAVEISSTGNTYKFSKWRVMADAQIDLEKYPDIWMRQEKDSKRNWIGRVTYLASDETELAAIKAVLEAESISYDMEGNVEATADEKAAIEASGITDRSQVPNTISKAAEIETDLALLTSADAQTKAFLKKWVLSKGV